MSYDDPAEPTRPQLTLVDRMMNPETRRQWIRRVLACRELTAGHKTVLLALETFADYRDGTNAHPGETNLAEMCGLSTRAVRAALSSGQDLGLVERTAPANPNIGRAATYRLTLRSSQPGHTGTVVPVETPPHTGSGVPASDAHTGTPAHPYRNADVSHTGTYVPPTLQRPSNYQGVSPDRGTSLAAEAITHTPQAPSKFCDEHPHGYRGKCGGCANSRTAFEAWQAAAAEHDLALAAADDLERRRRRRLAEHCPDCHGTNFRDDPGDPDDSRVMRCDHRTAKIAVGDA